MFSLFRKNRKIFLNEAEITRYLKYAVSEGVLVVIGILIVVQVRNYNEQRIEKPQYLLNAWDMGLVKSMDIVSDNEHQKVIEIHKSRSLADNILKFKMAI